MVLFMTQRANKNSILLAPSSEPVCARYVT
jgi:hypothetical protein